MSHDLEDLLNLIKELEARVNKLEFQNTLVLRKYENADSYYWEHG